MQKAAFYVKECTVHVWQLACLPCGLLLLGASLLRRMRIDTRADQLINLPVERRRLQTGGVDRTKGRTVCKSMCNPSLSTVSILHAEFKSMKRDTKSETSPHNTSIPCYPLSSDILYHHDEKPSSCGSTNHSPLIRRS